MRFLVDAQLPPGLAERLRDIGHEAVHVREIELGDAADAAIWRHACYAHMVLVTKDQDFLSLVRSSQPATPVILVRLGNTTNRALWAAIGPVMGEAIKAIEDGEAIVEIR